MKPDGAGETRDEGMKQIIKSIQKQLETSFRPEPSSYMLHKDNMEIERGNHTGYLIHAGSSTLMRHEENSRGLR